MKRKLLSVLLIVLISSFVFAKDYQTKNGISLTNENKNLCVSICLNNNETLKSIYDRGVVTRYSDDEQNETGLGKFVEIEYELGFSFEDSFKSYGIIKLIFSNVQTILVDENTTVEKGTPLIITKKGNESLRIFEISETDKIKPLVMLTKDKKEKVGDYWYWDPTYLVK